MIAMLLATAPVAAQSGAQVPAAPPGPCDAYRATPIPPSDLPTLDDVHSLPNAGKECSALDLYYGSGSARFASARVCGFAELHMLRGAANPNRTDSDLDSDDSLVLAMLYTNGEGVKRYVPLAKRFACASDNFVQTDDVLKQIDSGGRLEICGPDGSHYGRRPNYLCLGIEQDKVDSELKQQRIQTEKAIPPDSIAAFHALQSAWSTYREAHGAEEPNGNTGAVQSGMDNELNLDRFWIVALKSIATGTPPSAAVGSVDLPSQDKTLNENYREALRLAASCGGDACTTAEQVRTAERAWLRYREAWMHFAAIRWPKVPADSWRAWLTQMRIQDLP
jgi:uncharacterized protein YecT (DUF1311 family)